MLNLAEYRQRPALLADWLPWAGLIAPGVVLNKDGSFQRTARFRGPDLDSATQGELIATSARLNNALRRLGSGGGPLPDWLVDQFEARFGIEIVNYFGSNEGAALSSTARDS